MTNKYYYSMETGSMYASSVHASFPSDAVEISKEEHLIFASALAEGKIIKVGDDGRPCVADAPPPTNNQICQLVADRRYVEETSGIKAGGVPIDTGRDSQQLITCAALSAMRDPGYVCNWKTVSGFVVLNADALLSIADAIRAHVQACFDREGELLAALENGTFTPSMLDEGWPA